MKRKARPKSWHVPRDSRVRTGMDQLTSSVKKRTTHNAVLRFAKKLDSGAYGVGYDVKNTVLKATRTPKRRRRG